jgi:hypothetical protein
VAPRSWAGRRIRGDEGGGVFADGAGGITPIRNEGDEEAMRVKKPKKLTKVQELERHLKVQTEAADRLRNRATELSNHLDAIVEALWPSLKDRVEEIVREEVESSIDDLKVSR